MSELELAPLLLARAAAWPEASLSGLGRSGAVSSLSSSRADAIYAEVLAADRLALFQVTLGDPRFLRALALANPELSSLAARFDPLAARNKRTRHLETALYRYLARAVGRTAPCDLWAGVALAQFGARTVLEPCASQVRLSPDLRPFQSLLRGLGQRPEQRRRARFALNPTLRPVDGGWRWASDGNDVGSEQLLARHPIAERVIDVLSTRPALAFTRIVAAAAGPDAPKEAVARLVERMIDARILVGGLDLPVRFSSPEQALEQVEEQLAGPERSAFEQARLGLLNVAEALASELDTLDPEQIRTRLADARGRVVALAKSWELSLELPRAVLRADLVLPYRLTLGPEMRRALQRSVERYELFQAELGLAAPFRASLYGRIGADARGVAPWPPPPWLAGEDELAAEAHSWEALAAARQVSPELAPRFAQWEGLLRAQHTAVHPVLDGRAHDTRWLAPLGCLVTTLGRTTGGEPSQFVHGLLDEPLSVYSRFAHVLGAPALPLERWFAARLGRAARQAGIELWDYGGDFPENPNALARPAIVKKLLSPWSGQGNARLEQGATLSGSPPLYRRASGRPVAVLSTVAAPFARDRLARLLLISGFHDAPFESSNAASILFDAERTRGGAPAVELDPELMVRRRRTLLAGDTLSALQQASSAERFWRWQALAQRYDWPARVWVRRAAEAPLLVVRDSPIAVEAALEGARNAAELAIEDGPARSWLTGPDGGEYALELMVPFARARHAWTADAQTGSMPSTVSQK